MTRGGAFYRLRNDPVYRVRSAALFTAGLGARGAALVMRIGHRLFDPLFEASASLGEYATRRLVSSPVAIGQPQGELGGSFVAELETKPQEPATRVAPKLQESGPKPRPEPHFASLTNLLRASRTELDELAAKTHEMHRTSSQTVQSLLQEVHAKFHQELEAASETFAGDIRKSSQGAASAALDAFGQEAKGRQAAMLSEAASRIQGASKEAEESLRKRAEGHQKKLSESAASALEQIQLRGRVLFDGLRLELQSAFEDLKSKSKREISEYLQATEAALGPELRRRSDASFEFLNEQLAKSGRTLLENAEKQILDLGQSTLARLDKEAAATVREHVALGIEALNEAAERTQARVQEQVQQAWEAFERRAADLTNAKLGFLVSDLQYRLDQAGRAMQTTKTEAPAVDQKQLAD